MKQIRSRVFLTLVALGLMFSLFAEGQSSTELKTLINELTAPQGGLSALKKPHAPLNTTTTKWAAGSDLEKSAFGWLLFAYVNQPAPGAGRLWESWASDPATFGTAKSTGKPAVPAANEPWVNVFAESFNARTLTKPAQLQDLTAVGGSSQFKSNKAVANKNNANGKVKFYVDLILNNVKEEARRNQPVYDYITRQRAVGSGRNKETIRLNTQAGLKAYLKSGKTSLDFPADSLEIKADWLELDAVTANDQYLDDNDYYTATYEGKTYGLVAFHIMSKATPNWFWVTFEHKDNPLYNQQFGLSNDKFGPATRANNPAVARQAKERVQQLLKAANMNEPYWMNYRQGVWQTAPGRPASNSITEAPLSTGSCITCHARATFNPKAPAGYIGSVAPTSPKKDFRLFDSAVASKDITKNSKEVELGGWPGFLGPGKVNIYFPKTSSITCPKDAPKCGRSTAKNTLDLDKVWALFKAQ